MEKTGKQRSAWKGRKAANGLYRINYGEPYTVREILTLGMHSTALRIFLCTLVFTAAQAGFSLFAYPVLNFLKGKDLLFLFLGLLILTGSFAAGKKFGRGYAILFKWIGMPMVFLGVFAFGLVRLGLAAFWVSPFDLFLGDTAEKLMANGTDYGAFRGLLKGLSGLKGIFLKGDAGSSIFTGLMNLYRRISSSMNFYAVVPVLVLISLGVFLLTMLLVNLCGIVTLILPTAVCYGLTRLLGELDRRI